jgi:hypothetical protein
MKNHHLALSNSGSILLAVMLLLGLLSSISVHSLHGLYVRTKALQAEVHAQRSHFDALQEAALQSPTQPNPDRLACLKGKATHAALTLQRSICALISNAVHSLLSQSLIEGVSLSSALDFPLIDYQNFENAQPSCLQTYNTAPNIMPSGQALSAAALVAKDNCSLQNNAIQRVKGNLVADSNFQGLTHSTNATLLVSTGFIDIPTTLNLSTPSLIIAAGDIYVKTLNSNYPITIVSTSGLVQIDAFQGNPQIKVIAWLGALLPSSISSADNHLLPPLRSLVAVAITAPNQTSN